MFQSAIDKHTRTLPRLLSGALLCGFALFYALWFTRYPIAGPQGVVRFAAPSAIALGLMVAAGLHLMGVSVRAGGSLDALPALALFALACALSGTPFWAGYETASAAGHMAIYTCTLAGLLAIHCVTALLQGQPLSLKPKCALLLLLVMALCVCAQYSQQAALFALMGDALAPHPRNAAYWLLLLLPLLHALLTAAAVGFCLQVRNGAWAPCLIIGLIGVAVRILAQLLPALAQGPFSILFDSSLIGPAGVDQLTLCLALVVMAIRSLRQPKAARMAATA